MQTNKVDIYDPRTNKWAGATSLPALSEAISPEAETLQDGDVMVTGIGVSGTSTDVYTPSFPGPPVSPPAQNCADLTKPFKVTSVKVGSGHTVKVTALVPESGKLAAIAIAQKYRTSTPKKWFGYGGTRRSIGRRERSLTISARAAGPGSAEVGAHAEGEDNDRIQAASGPERDQTVAVGVRGGEGVRGRGRRVGPCARRAVRGSERGPAGSGPEGGLSMPDRRVVG